MNNSVPNGKVFFNDISTNRDNHSEIKGVRIQGKGSDLGNSKALEGRTKRKGITQTIILPLIDIAGKRKADERKKSYWNTYHCQNSITVVDGRIHGIYCKNRFCTLCQSIRKAVIINQYFPVMQGWEEPHLVTITARSVSKGNLPKRMRDMNRGLRIIVSRNRKRNQRGKGIKLIGIK